MLFAALQWYFMYYQYHGPLPLNEVGHLSVTDTSMTFCSL